MLIMNIIIMKKNRGSYRLEYTQRRPKQEEGITLFSRIVERLGIFSMVSERENDRKRWVKRGGIP